MRRVLLLVVLVVGVGAIAVWHHPMADAVRARNPVARLGRRVATQLRESRLGRSLTRAGRGAVVHRIR